MAAQQPVGDSDEQEEQWLRGLLFRISIRAGALVFVAVLAAGVWSGLGPDAALVRALLALVALTWCGWLAEQVARAPWRQLFHSEEPGPVSMATTSQPVEPAGEDA